MAGQNPQNADGEVSDARVGWTGGLNKSLSKQILLEHFGLVCWGCGFEPPKRYSGTQDQGLLQLDHIRPKRPSFGKAGSDELYNLAILCPTCNGAKSNSKTLEQLRRVNDEKGLLYVESISNLVELDGREQYAIREIFQHEESGHTRKMLQDIFGMIIQATGTSRKSISARPGGQNPR